MARGSQAAFEVRWATCDRPLFQNHCGVVARAERNHAGEFEATRVAPRSAWNGQQGEALSGALIGEQRESLACDRAEQLQ